MPPPEPPDPPYMHHSTTVLVVENREPTAKELASARVVIRVEATTGSALATVIKGGNAVDIKW